MWPHLRIRQQPEHIHADDASLLVKGLCVTENN